MRNPTNDYITNEEAIQHRPLEIYKLYNSSENYYWTSMDRNITYGGNTYTPMPIKRGTIEQSSDLSPSKLTIDLPYFAEGLDDTAVDMPLEDYSLMITRLFADDLTEGVVQFMGELKSTSFKGPMLRAEFVSRHSILDCIVPRYRYQIECNWELYSTKCGLNKNSYKTTTTATVVSGTSYTQLTSDDFDIASVQNTPYFRHGYIDYNGHTRSILEHQEDTITIDYKIPGLTTSGTVDVYAGCDWRVETCNSKFSNLNNFGGDPEIPRGDSPVTWV